MATYPVRGSAPWDLTLKDYIDGADATNEADLSTHVADKTNPHAVTKTQVGLANVDNTSDVNKPVSTAQAVAIAAVKSLDDFDDKSKGTTAGLTTYTTPGVYQIYSTNSGNPVPAQGGHLRVFATDNGYIAQEYTTITLNRKLVRSSGDNGATWSPWLEVSVGTPGILDGTIHGNGSPEGVVSAAVGRRYIDDTAANGAIEWIKTFLGPNTGWSVVYGATARRDLTAKLINGWAASKVTVQRVGSVCSLTIEGLDPSAATSDLFFSPPSAGFGANPSVISPVVRVTAPASIRVFSDGFHMQGFVTGSGTYNGALSYITPDQWPSILP